MVGRTSRVCGQRKKKKKYPNPLTLVYPIIIPKRTVTKVFAGQGDVGCMMRVVDVDVIGGARMLTWWHWRVLVKSGQRG